jgi:hypothetical protein
VMVVHEGRTPLRPRSEIEAARAAALEWLPTTRYQDFVRGAIVAFDWLLGRRGEAPLSGVVVFEPTWQQIIHEEQVADDVTYRRRGAPDRPQDYAVGVANALEWGRGVPGVFPPIDFDPPAGLSATG